MLTVGDQKDPEFTNRHKTVFGALMTLVFLITSLVFISIYSTRIKSEGSMKVSHYYLHQQRMDVLNFTDADFIPTIRFYSAENSYETVPYEVLYNLFDF